MASSDLPPSNDQRPNDEALEGALKTEDDFLAYLASVRPEGHVKTPPTAAKTKRQHQHQQQQQQQPPQSSPPTSVGPQVPQVGLDHLDNLCRLMEQLGSLREQNSMLQKRVHYLEDLHAVRTELNLHRPQSDDSILESIPTTVDGRERSKSEDMGTCQRKNGDHKGDRLNVRIGDQTQTWDSSVEDTDSLSPSATGFQGRSLDRGIRLQQHQEIDTKKRNSAWGRVKTIIQTRKDSLKRKQRRPESSVPDTSELEATIAQGEEVKKAKSVANQTAESSSGNDQDGAPGTSKWTKVKRAFLTKRSQPIPLQRSQSVPSNPFDEEDLELMAEDFTDEADFERPISQDIQRHIAEIQRNLSQDFNRKLTEWERIRRSGSGKQSNQKRSKKDLQWLDKELSKLARDKERLARERQKFDEREERLQRLRRSLRVPRDDDDQVLVRTAQGEFRFPGISGTFTRRLLEWEEKRGLGPDLSTLALLDQSTASANKAKPAKLERNRSRSDSSIVENNAQREDAFRATSEPELTRPSVHDRTGSYGNLLDDNLILLEQLRSKEETCCQLQGELERLDVRIKEMLGNHSKELDKYRQQLEGQQQGAADHRLLADIQCHLKDLHSAEKRLETNRRELEASYSKHSDQQTALAQELVDKMVELHSRSPKPNDLEKQETPKIPEVDVTRIQALSNELLQQAQQLEEALADRNTMLRHLRWELLERETTSILQQSQPPPRRKPRKHWSSLEGITSPYIPKKDDSQRNATPEVDILSEALQARVRALQEGLVKLWTSTEQSPHVSHRASFEKNDDTEIEEMEPINSYSSRPRSLTVRARRLSDTSIHYDKNTLTNGSTEESGIPKDKQISPDDLSQIPWRKPERRLLYAIERTPSNGTDPEFLVPGAKLDFAAAFSMAICDEDALTPLQLPELPKSAAATISTTTELECPPPSTIPSTVEQENARKHEDFAPVRQQSTSSNQRLIYAQADGVCKSSSFATTEAPNPEPNYESSSSYLDEKLDVPLASSDTDTDDSLGATFTTAQSSDSDANYKEQSEKLHAKDKLRPSTPIKQRENSLLPIKVRGSPMSPPIVRRKQPNDSGAPCVRTMVARFNQRLTHAQADGVCKSSSFASTEAPKSHDVSKSASASDCRSGGQCRLPTRVPQSPKSGHSTPRTIRAAAAMETSSSVPVSPRLRPIFRGSTTDGTSSVPASPSRIPRPAMETCPQSPMARTRALKLRHAREEFLTRDLLTSPSPEVTRRIATVSPVIQRRYDNSHESRSEQRQQEINESSYQQQHHRIATKVLQPVATIVETNNEIATRETLEVPDPSQSHKSGFFSFRFRKSKLKKKETSTTIGMLCRQSLLVDIPDNNTEVTPGDSSPQSCSSSPEAPRCTRAKPSWLTKPKLFKQK